MSDGTNVPRAGSFVTRATLSDRALNRATLARQGLLAREDVTAAALIERFAGLQAQDVTTPYVTLWTRLARFAPDDLQGLLADGSVLRVPLWRNTIHHVVAVDFARFFALSREGANYRPKVVREQPENVPAVARELLAAEPLNMTALGRALAGRFPGGDPFGLANAARGALPLRHLPPCGFWMTGAAPLIGLWDAVGETLEREAFVRRYLAAFGPASVRDAQYFAGVTKLGPAFEALRDELIVFENDRGVELFDLPGAPRPPAGTEAPVRFLGVFDNALIGYADRARIIRPGYGKVRGGGLEAPILIDGFADGVWSCRRGEDVVVTVDREDVLQEAGRLAEFLGATGVRVAR